MPVNCFEGNHIVLRSDSAGSISDPVPRQQPVAPLAGPARAYNHIDWFLGGHVWPHAVARRACSNTCTADASAAAGLFSQQRKSSYQPQAQLRVCTAIKQRCRRKHSRKHTEWLHATAVARGAVAPWAMPGLFLAE